MCAKRNVINRGFEAMKAGDEGRGKKTRRYYSHQS